MSVKDLVCRIDQKPKENGHYRNASLASMSEAYVGALRYCEHRSRSQIHQQLQAKGFGVSERTVSNLLARYDELVSLKARYDELVSLKVSDSQRLREIVGQQSHAILAIDGMQPDVGHKVLWVVRECREWRDNACKDVAIGN